MSDGDMNVGSLFAGIGGFDVAAERVGMTVAWQSENNPSASKVLEHYWPGRNLGDIHNIRMESQVGRRPGDGTGTVPDITGSREPPVSEPVLRDTNSAGETDNERVAAAVDVLCGGFPCQDYSVAGNRAGLAGNRGALWWQFHRLIVEGHPTWVVGENVPGLLSSRGGQDFATIIDSLIECGYGVAWGVLDAQYFGVAQRRRRVFIVGHSGGEPRPEILALSEGVHGYPAPSREAGQGVTGTLAARTQGGGGLGTALDLAGGVIAFNWQSGQGQLQESVDATGTLHVGQTPAIMTGPTVRRLTPLECERLQGFPDGWTDIPGNSDTQRYRQLGNAVAVPVVEWILKRIMEVTGDE